eukprot:Trichotokara_eunicae@DN5274_c0_g1_i2.p1
MNDKGLQLLSEFADAREKFDAKRLKESIDKDILAVYEGYPQMRPMVFEMIRNAKRDILREHIKIYTTVGLKDLSQQLNMTFKETVEVLITLTEPPIEIDGISPNATVQVLHEDTQTMNRLLEVYNTVPWSSATEGRMKGRQQPSPQPLTNFS